MIRRRIVEKGYDLWEENISTAGPDKKENVKQKRPAYVPSILAAVQIPSEGTSYNPPISSYTEYVKCIAQEESKLLAQERRIEVSTKLASSSKLATETFREECQIFKDALDEIKVEMPNDEFLQPKLETKEDDSQTNMERKKPKSKTAKQKRDLERRRLAEIKRSNKLQKKKISQQLMNLKSLTKTVRKELALHEEKIEEKRKDRTIQRLTSKKRLGRGQYENFIEPVSLVNELKGNMRSTYQHIDVLKERVKSLQKRNILPTPGSRTKPSKASLRFKVVEKRASREFV